MSSLRQLLAIVRHPVRADTRAHLARNWERVPAPLRVSRQMLGRAGNGCGATIGAMPRCDFACTGCYLGEGANRVPPATLDEVKAQIRLLRPALGHAGNLQLTDGEITLRPVEEIVELLRYARSLDLIPMLMTHGDSFRRRPGLLEHLVVAGGLTEVSIHVDTTQRGRLGERYRGVTEEADLNPLRDEFATMLRDVSRRTRRPLRGATTMTVTAANLSGVPAVIRWLCANADAFRLISFQPVAQVGRTIPGVGAITLGALWRQIAIGFDGPDAEPERYERGQLWVGHPGCSRYLPGVLLTQPGQQAKFRPVRTEGDPLDHRVVDGFLARFGGVSFRLDGRRERLARWLGMLLADPRFVLGSLPGFVSGWLRRLSPGRPWRLALQLLAGRARVQGLVIVSHHFMDQVQVVSPEGRERLDLCVFQVPIGGRLLSMCEANTLGHRERLYADLSSRDALPMAPVEAG